MRGGLAWIDSESVRRFGHGFAEARRPSARRVLDEIA